MARPNAQQLTTLGSLAGDALANDSQLRSRTQEIVDDTLKLAQYTIRFGTPADRAAMMKATVPVMMRSLQDQAADEREQNRRDAYDRILAKLRGEIPVDDSDDVTEDWAPEQIVRVSNP